LKLDMQDEITADTLVTRGGEIVHPMVRRLLELAPLNGEALGRKATAGDEKKE
jgi:hypothetical protein